MDHNSAYGLFAMVLAFDEKVKLLKQTIRRPPNTTRLRLLAAFFQSLATTRSWSEAERRFVENRPKGCSEETVTSVLDLARRVAERARVVCHGTVLSGRARRVAEMALRKVRKLNREWMKEVEAELRELVRSLLDGGYHVAIVIDLPDPETLKGTELQRTLLRVARRLRNLCLYEGAEYVELNGVSGRKCPLCGGWGEEVQPRYHRCERCGLVWGRDWAACFRAATAYLAMRRAREHAEALLSWLRSHPRSLVHGSRSFPRAVAAPALRGRMAAAGPGARGDEPRRRGGPHDARSRPTGRGPLSCEGGG